MKHSASRPKTPSTDTTSGVNEARRASAASLYFLILNYNIVTTTTLSFHQEMTEKCKALFCRSIDEFGQSHLAAKLEEGDFKEQ